MDLRFAEARPQGRDGAARGRPAPRSSPPRLGGSELPYGRRAYHSLGDSGNYASSLISEGIALREAGNPQKAIVAFVRALSAIDERADDKLRLSGLQCLCWGLCDAGKYEHAHALSRQCSRLFFSSKEPGIAIRVVLLNARIDDGLGLWLAAEQGYERCREYFAAAGMLCEQAIATLHLAALLAAEGRTSEARDLCAEVHEVFGTLGIARESTAALLLRDAMDYPKAELLKTVAHYLEREVRQPARRKTASE